MLEDIGPSIKIMNLFHSCLNSGVACLQVEKKKGKILKEFRETAVFDYCLNTKYSRYQKPFIKLRNRKSKIGKSKAKESVADKLLEMKKWV